MPRPRLNPRTRPIDDNPLAALLSLVDRASARVPVVKYAFGLVGIAACGAIAAGLIGKTSNSLVVVGLTFVGGILLFVFSRLAASQSRAVQSAGAFLVWIIVGFFSFFLLFTTTAFVAGFPEPWARFLGLSNADKMLAERAACDNKVRVLWVMFMNPSNQTDDARSLARDVSNCNRFQAETVLGALDFYGGDYFGAVTHFEAAVSLEPKDGPANRNLGDAYVEVGRYDEALSAYGRIPMKNALWHYKIARVLYHAGRLDEALNIVAKIPGDLTEDGNLPGRPRVLQSAVLAEKAKLVAPQDQQPLIDSATRQLKEGISFSQSEWRRILTQAPHRTKHETFGRQVETLRLYIDEWTKGSGESGPQACDVAGK